jgi:hypothetical protein
MNKESVDMCNEIREIGQIISSAALMMSIRKEVAKVMKEGFVVTDGRHHPTATKYDVVIRCGGKDEEVTRRLRDGVTNIDVDKIANGVLGIKIARRSKRIL